FTSYTGSFFLVTQGTHTVQWVASDHVGNVSATGSAVFYEDNQPPVTTIVFSTPAYVNASSQTYIATRNRAEFAVASPVGVAATYYRINPTAQTKFRTFASSFTLAKGSNTVQAYSVDLLNHVEPVETFIVYVDTAPPVTSVVIGQPQNTSTNGKTLI